MWWGGVCVVGKPNLVKCFGPRLHLWTWTLDFVTWPSFSIIIPVLVTLMAIKYSVKNKLFTPPGYQDDDEGTRSRLQTTVQGVLLTKH